MTLTQHDPLDVLDAQFDAHVVEYLIDRLAEEALDPLLTAVYQYIEKHRPPDAFLDHSNNVDTWLLTGGRGGGKTFCAAIFFDSKMRARRGVKGRIIAPTKGEALQSCVLGESGICTLFPDVKVIQSGTQTIVRWPNGSEAIVLGAYTQKEVEKLRAYGNRELDWFEEFTHIPKMKEAWTQATFGRRSGPYPQAIVTTTPTPHPFWAEMMALSTTVHTHSTMFDNPHLPEVYKANILELFKGTSLEGQEIYGEIETDVIGALWSTQMLHDGRIPLGGSPSCNLTVVGVDPATGRGTTGIVVAGSFKHADRWQVAALDDYSRTDVLPEDWGKAVVKAYLDYDCDYIIAEGNQGGRMVKSTIKNAADNWDTDDGSVLTVPVRVVSAQVGKQARAQPISMLFEQGRGHIVGRLPFLENELTTWVPDVSDSPDRLDAMVWAMTFLQERFRRGRGNISKDTSL